jgi:hypothetical protein
LPFLDPPKKVVIGALRPFDYGLKQRLRHFSQFWANFFASRQLGALLFVGEGKACHAIGTFAFIEGGIVGLAAQATLQARLVVCE